MEGTFEVVGREKLLAEDAVVAASAAVGLLASARDASVSMSEIQIFDTGWDFRVFKAAKWVIRVARNSVQSAKLSAECAFLDEIRPALTVPTPDSLEYAPGVSIGHWLPGCDLVNSDFVLVQGVLAENLARLHRLPLSTLQNAPAPSLSDTREKVAMVLRKAAVPGVMSADVETLKGGLSDPQLWSYEPRIVHADLAACHILFDKAKGRMSGIIDWADARIDDPAIDFAGIERDLGDEAADRLVAAYSSQMKTNLGERFRERVHFRAAWARVIECLQGGLS